MLPLLPWMPATALVLGMENEEIRRQADLIRMKTEAIAKNLRIKAPIHKWEPIGVRFEQDGQRLGFTSVSLTGHHNFKTNLEITNEVALYDEQAPVVTFIEHMEVVIDDYRNKTPQEIPAQTSCTLMVKLADHLPEVVRNDLPGRRLEELVELPAAFTSLGHLKMDRAISRRIILNIEEFAEQAAALHRAFQSSLPAF